MTKITMGITIESTIADQYKSIVGKGNVSSDIEEFMRSKILAKHRIVNTADVLLLNKELEEKERQKMEIDTEVVLLRDQKRVIDEQVSAKEKEDLLAQKEREENAKKCVVCGGFIDDLKNYKTAAGGMMCHSCFNGLSVDALKKYF